MNKATCNGCGKTGHIKKFCKSTNKEKKEETNATSPEVSTTSFFCCVISPVFSPIPPSSGFSSTETDSGPFKSRMKTAFACTNTVAATTPIYNTKVVLDCGATDHFFCNWEFFTTFTEYYHEFQTGSGQIVSAYGYGDVVLNLIHHNKAINVFTIQKVSWTPALGHNLLSTILLALKGVEIHLKKSGEPSQIWYNGKLQGLADIIDRQYVLQTQPSNIAIQMSFANTIPIVNAVKPTLELWHQRMRHLGYQNLLKLPQLASGIDVKGPVPDSICGPCMKKRQRRKPC